MSIGENTSYKDFTTIISGKIKTFIGKVENQQAISNYRYSGFSIATVYEEFLRIVLLHDLSEEKIIEDLTNMVGLYFVGGPNPIKISEENTIGSTGNFSTMQALINRYGLKLNKKGAKDITLVRLVMVFPVQVLTIYTALKPEYINNPILDTEVELPGTQIFSMRFIPDFLDFNDFEKDNTTTYIFLIYNIFQSYLSYRTKLNLVDSRFEPSTKDPLKNFQRFHQVCPPCFSWILNKFRSQSYLLE